MSLLKHDTEAAPAENVRDENYASSSAVARHIAGHFRGRVPDHENRAAAYYWERKRQLVLELIASHLPEMRAGTTAGNRPLFVDIGSGDATDIFMIASYLNRHDPGWRFLGLEGLASAIEEAERRNASYGISGVEFRLTNVTRGLPLDDASADVLYCSEVLEHIPEPEKLLAQFARVVRRGGFILVTTPNEPNVFQRSWWSKAHNERLKRESAGKKPVAESMIAGEMVKLYGHISLHSNSEWDRMMAGQGLMRVDFRRGAAVYGGQPFYRKAGFHQARLFGEWMLDLFPRSLVRNLSDQVIALYRRA